MEKHGRRSVSHAPRLVVVRCKVRAKVVTARGRTGVHGAKSGATRCKEAGSLVGVLPNPAGGRALRSRTKGSEVARSNRGPCYEVQGGAA